MESSVKKKIEHYCAYQERCHLEVTNKLNKLGVFGDELDEYVCYLIDENFLSETRFSEAYVRGKFNNNNWGKVKISRELKDCEGVKTIFPFGHVADGNIHFIIGKDSDDNDLKSKINDIIYNNTQLVNGSISAEHGIGLDKKKYLIKSRSEDEIELMRLLKKSIDPKNILNPGRVI